MILDADQLEALPTGEQYDVCIAGAGVAGIVLGLRLAGARWRVLVLEGGGLEFSEQSQSLYEGESIGRPYEPLDVSRLRYFGGTSNHWAGWCRPLDAYDFEVRPQTPGSGWPIGKAELDPYLSEACNILEVGPFPEDRPLGGEDASIKEVALLQSPPVRMGEKYRAALESQDGLTVLCNANLVDIQVDEGNGRVTAFIVQGYRSSAERGRITANRYVLAMGGIENARILLNADRQIPSGLGNRAGLVGRHFMDHPGGVLGFYLMEQGNGPFGDELRFAAPSERFIRAQGINNCLVVVKPIATDAEAKPQGLLQAIKTTIKERICANDIALDLTRSLYQFRCPETADARVLASAPASAGLLKVIVEQAPNPDSRVMLAEERDRFGLRRVVLDWRLSPIDIATIRAVGMQFGRSFAANNLGRAKMVGWVLDEDAQMPGLHDGADDVSNHHIGTTRMGTSWQDGVVDADCRVFGTDNLFVAGSSVFRTGGAANPTLSIVQLALRLTDHLDREMRS